MGPRNFGLLDPARMAMTSLFQITTTFVLDEPSVEDLVLVHAVDVLKKAAEESFAEANRKLEEDEAAIDWEEPGRVAHLTRNLPRREISERSSILRDVAGDPSMVYALFLARTR
jgi:hypothetical protein